MTALKKLTAEARRAQSFKDYQRKALRSLRRKLAFFNSLK